MYDNVEWVQLGSGLSLTILASLCLQSCNYAVRYHWESFSTVLHNRNRETTNTIVMLKANCTALSNAWQKGKKKIKIKLIIYSASGDDNQTV